MTRILMLVLLALLLAMSACEDDPVAATDPIAVDAYFALNVDGAPLQLNSLVFTNPAGTVYSIKDLRFIISDVKLLTDEGKSVMLKSVHYFDIADASTQVIHVGNLPHANFTGISFTFGLNAARNTRDEYPAIPALMAWPAALGEDLGYHYMQITGNYETTPGGATNGYTTHTGPRHLDGTNPAFPGVVDPVALHFSFPVTASFTPAHIHEDGHGELEISFNLNDWYLDHTPLDGVDTGYDFKTLTNPAVMGHLEEQGKLQANGPDCFSASLVVHGGHH